MTTAAAVANLHVVCSVAFIYIDLNNVVVVFLMQMSLNRIHPISISSNLGIGLLWLAELLGLATLLN